MAPTDRLGPRVALMTGSRRGTHGETRSTPVALLGGTEHMGH